MKIKMSQAEKGFIMGVAFEYLASQPKGFIYALRDEILNNRRKVQIELDRKVDPYNRTVEV